MSPSKYSPEQLQSMATQVIQAMQSGDPRAATFLMEVAKATGLPVSDVVQATIRFAVGDTP